MNELTTDHGKWKIKEDYNVLSYFDGMSCGQLALQRVGKKVTNYFASEIDKFAINIAVKNFPNTIEIGDVTKVKIKELPKISLFIGGSPCQGFSFSGKQLNFNDPRSRLFFEFAADLRYIQEFINPNVKFLLENVKMKKEYQNIITKFLGVEPEEINSSKVSAQGRKRLYWTNICEIQQPEDKCIFPDQVLEKNVNKKYYVSETQLKRLDIGNIKRFGGISFKNKGTEKQKCDCLLRRHYKGISGKQDFPIVLENDGLRKLTPIECERMQTIPDNYTDCVSDTQRYASIGNGWTIDIIAHIFKNL